MVSEQRHQKQQEGRLVEETRQTKRQCEQQMAELEGQMQDLMFFLRAQEEVSRWWVGALFSFCVLVASKMATGFGIASSSRCLVVRVVLLGARPGGGSLGLIVCLEILCSPVTCVFPVTPKTCFYTHPPCQFHPWYFASSFHGLLSTILFNQHQR